MHNMDELFELYYRSEEDFYKQQNTVLPYAVNCKEHNRIPLLVSPLKEAGFTFVPTLKGFPNQMTSFLIDMDFKKYYKMPFPVGCNCVERRVYTVEEFIGEIFNKTKK